MEAMRLAEAALFMSPRPLTLAELSRLVGVAEGDAAAMLNALQAEYDSHAGAIRIALNDGAYSMQLRDEYAERVAHFAQEAEISRGALKTLALISKHAPVQQSKIVKALGGRVYEHVAELEEKGFLNAEKKGRTRLLKLTQKFKEYFKTG
jgi:segregation and condensation protein B